MKTYTHFDIALQLTLVTFAIIGLSFLFTVHPAWFLTTFAIATAHLVLGVLDKRRSGSTSQPDG